MAPRLLGTQRARRLTVAPNGTTVPQTNPKPDQPAPPALVRHLRILRIGDRGGEPVARPRTRSSDSSLGALTHVTGHEIASLHLVSSGRRAAAPAARRPRSSPIASARSTSMLPMGRGTYRAAWRRPASARRVDDVARAARPPARGARAAVIADGIRGLRLRAHPRAPAPAGHSLARPAGRAIASAIAEVALLECVRRPDRAGAGQCAALLRDPHQLQELEKLARAAAVRAERMSAVGGAGRGGVAARDQQPAHHHPGRRCTCCCRSARRGAADLTLQRHRRRRQARGQHRAGPALLRRARARPARARVCHPID